MKKYVKLVLKLVKSSAEKNYKQSKENNHETFWIYYLPRKTVSKLLHSLLVGKQRKAVKKCLCKKENNGIVANK